MDPLVYMLPKSDKIVEPVQYLFDENPSPKLIRYGFNNISDEFDLVALTANPHYTAGLNFDFKRSDDTGIVSKANAFFKMKNFNLDFAEFWEILTLFGLLKNDQIIKTTNQQTLLDLTSVYEKVFNVKNSYKINPSTKQKVSLVITKYSDIDIDENAAIQLIINDLPLLLSIQTEQSSMIIQLFGLQTQTSAELIYFLSSMYEDAYLMKPTVTSDLSNSKYLILIGLKKTAPKITIPKHSTNNTYLISFGLTQIPDDLTEIIQCINSDTMPKKFKTYSQIKEYLDSKVYEGATYQQMIQAQNNNTAKWLETFGMEIDKLPTVLDKSLKKTAMKCGTHTQLVKMLG